jgi:hypothetical protein
MKQILSTQDRSLAESLRIELEAAGIDTLDPSDLALAAHAPVTVTIVSDQDYNQAIRILYNLSRTANSSRLPGWLRWPLRLAFLIIILFAIALTADFLSR